MYVHLQMWRGLTITYGCYVDLLVARGRLALGIQLLDNLHHGADPHGCRDVMFAYLRFL